MSRSQKAHTRMSEVIASAVRLAFPDSRAKRLAMALGCSIVTGKRIARTGRASPRWEVVSVLRQELARNRKALEEIDAALGDIEHARDLAAAAARAATNVGEAAAMADRPGDGAGAA